MVGMASLAAATSGGASITTILLIIAGSSTGIVGAIVGLVKLGSDKGTAAIAQATGANEALEATLEAVERERDYWKRRYENCRVAYDQLIERVHGTGP